MEEQANRSVFAGVRVIELAQFVFVPGAGALLADFGAEVIKIEEPVGGDPYRSLQINDGRQTGSANLAMEMNNRGKKSLALDLKSPEGRELLLDLIKTADIFLTSLRPGAIARLGLDVADLRKVNPDLIYIRGNGVGFAGEQADRPGYDASCFWARGGFASVLRPPGHDHPIAPRPALGDHAGAANVALGAAMALFKRARTGEPSVIDVSLLSTALWMLSADLVLAQAPGYAEPAVARKASPHPMMAAYRCRDGRWLQLLLLDPARYWPGLCERLERPDLIAHPDYATNDLRGQNSDALYRLLSDVFATRDARNWGNHLEGWDAPWEYVQSISEVSQDKEARATGHFFDVEVADGTKVEIISGPVTIDGSPRPVDPRRAPHKGEHTDALLAELGLSQARRDVLLAAGIIA